MPTGRILVVDDEVNARTALAELLREEGYDVETAADGFQALGKVESFAPDLVVTDLMMPGMDGIELLKQLRVVEQPPAVVVITAEGAVGSAVGAMLAGAADYLPKPINFDHLLVVTNRVFEHQQLRRETRLAHERVRQAQETEHFMLDAGVKLNASLELAAVVRSVARLGVPRLGDAGFVDVVAADGRLLRVAWAHSDPIAQNELDRIFGVEEPVQVFARPLTEAVATGRSILVPSVEEESFPVADVPIACRLGIRSALIVPLSLGARRFGALTFCLTGARRHGEPDIALAEELARRSSLAIEHARLYEQARNAVALRDQTLAIVSHDLRAPLQTIVLAATILRDEVRAGPASRVVAIDKIELAAERMDRMIGDLLDFASIDAGRLSIVAQPHDVAAIIDESTATFESMAKKHQVKLTGATHLDMPLVQCDRDRILQVIANLLGNALKIVRPGDSVCLGAEVRAREVVFSVSDTGPGIATAAHTRLFEQFWRSPDAGYKGTGLGLAIARGIVEAHRGRIWVQSEFGHGATFYFTLPLTERLSGPVRGDATSQHSVSMVAG